MKQEPERRQSGNPRSLGRGGVNGTYNQPAGVACTGIAGLDEILGGGLPRHHVYLLEGATGTGKTTLALQFIIDGARRGEPVLYITLSETSAELRQVAASHGWSLDGVALYELLPADEAPAPGRRYTFFHPTEVEGGRLLQQVFAEVERVQPARLIVDTLSGLRLLIQDSLFYRQQIQALRQFLTGRPCTTLLIDDLPAENLDYQPTSLVHGILRLERFLSSYGRARRRLSVVKLRGLDYADGYHDFRISTGGLVVYPNLLAAEHEITYPQEQVASGVGALDALLGGGLERGQSTLLLGPSGSGKSSVAMQYALAAAGRGEHCAVYLFDETVKTVLGRTDALGMDARAPLAAGRLVLTPVETATLSVGEFAHQVRQAVERDGARMVIIDSLGGYLHAMPEERFLTLHLHELLTYLGNRGVVTLLVLVQPGILGTELRSPIDLSSFADTVVLLRFFEARGQVRKAISVIKKRSGIHEQTIRELRLGSGGVRLGPPLENFQGVLTGIPQYTGEQQALLGKSR
ncbi:MAG: AAA family ATPase [Pseudomonadota bacterium]|nr:AAA family ATPase [Pseudomonadota bacterium]